MSVYVVRNVNWKYATRRVWPVRLEFIITWFGSRKTDTWISRAVRRSFLDLSNWSRSIARRRRGSSPSWRRPVLDRPRCRHRTSGSESPSTTSTTPASSRSESVWSWVGDSRVQGARSGWGMGQGVAFHAESKVWHFSLHFKMAYRITDYHNTTKHFRWWHIFDDGPMCRNVKAPAIILVLVWRKSIPFWRRCARKTISYILVPSDLDLDL